MQETDVGCCVSQVRYFQKAVTWAIGVHFLCIIYHFKTCDEMNKTQNHLSHFVLWSRLKLYFFLGRFLVLRFFPIFINSSRIFSFFLELRFECCLFFFLILIKRIIILYFIFVYFGKFAVFSLVIKGAINPNFIHSDFQYNLSLFKNLVSSFCKLNNIYVLSLNPKNWHYNIYLILDKCALYIWYYFISYNIMDDTTTNYFV